MSYLRSWFPFCHSATAFWAIACAAVLSGCTGGPDLPKMSSGNLFARDSDAEIRKAAIEDTSFPNATDPAPTSR